MNLPACIYFANPNHLISSTVILLLLVWVWGHIHHDNLLTDSTEWHQLHGFLSLLNPTFKCFLSFQDILLCSLTVWLTEISLKLAYLMKLDPITLCPKRWKNGNHWQTVIPHCTEKGEVLPFLQCIRSLNNLLQNCVCKVVTSYL